MKNVFIILILVACSVLVIAQAKHAGDQGQQKRGSTSMKEKAAATFAVKSWDEKPYNEMPGVPKLTRANVTKSYEGDIVGEGKLDYLMMYRDDGTATFTGLERVVATVGGRSGSFVLQHTGTFESGVATVSLSIVPGSGTEGLRGITGKGQFAAGHQPPYRMTLEYGFE